MRMWTVFFLWIFITYLAYVSTAPLEKTNPKSNRSYDAKLAPQTEDNLSQFTDENISLKSGSRLHELEETIDLKVSTLDNVRDNRRKEIMGKLKSKQLVQTKNKDEELGNTAGDNQNEDRRKALGENKVNDKGSIKLKDLSNSKSNKDNHIAMSDEFIEEIINSENVENDLIEELSNSPELDSKRPDRKTTKIDKKIQEDKVASKLKAMQEEKISKPLGKSTEAIQTDAKHITDIPNEGVILNNNKTPASIPQRIEFPKEQTNTKSDKNNKAQDIFNMLNPTRKITPYQSSWDPTMPEFNDDDFQNENGMMSLQSPSKPSQSLKSDPDDEDIDSLWDDQNKEKSDALDINNTPQPKVDKIPSKKYQKPVLKRPAYLKPLSGNKVVGPLSSDNNNDSPNVEYEESKMDKENSIPLEQYSDSLLGKENEPSTLDVPPVNGTPQSKSGNIPRKGKYQKPISRRPNNIYNQGDNKGFNNPNMDNNVGLVNDTDSLEVIVIEGSPDDIWNTETSNPTENINNHGEIVREYTSKNTQPDDEDIDSLWDDQNKEKSDALDINNTPQPKVDKIPSKKYQKPVLKRPAHLKPLSGNKVVGPLSSDNNNDSPNVEYEESKIDKENSIPLDQYSDSLLGKENEPSTLDVPPVNGTPQSKSGNIPRKGKYQKPISKRPNNIYNQGDNKGLNNPNMNNLEVVEIEGSPDDIWNTEMSNPTENINNPGEIVREYTSKNTQPDDEDIDSLWDEQNKEKSDALDINNMPQPKVDKIPSKKYQKPVLKRPAHLKPFSGNKVVGPLSSDNNYDSPNVEYEESKMDKENSIPLDQYSDSLLGKENEPSTLDVPLVNGTPQSKSGNIPRKGKYQKPISRRPNNIYNQGDNKGFNNPNMDNNVGLVNDTDSLEVIVIEGSPDDIWNTETSNPSENINNPGEITREYTSKNTQPDDEDIDSLWDDQNKEKSDALDINNTPQSKVDKIPSKKYQKPVLKRPAYLKPLSGNKVVGPLSSDNNNDSPNVEYEESKMDKENSIPLDQYSDSLWGKENEPSTLDVPPVNGTPQSKSGNIPRKGKYQKPISRRPNNIYNQGDNKGLNNPNMNNLEVVEIEGSPDDIWNTEMSNPTENINNPGEIVREYTSKNTQPDDEDIDSLWDEQNKEKSDALDINNMPQPKVDKIPSKKYQKPVLKRPAHLKPFSGNKVVGPLSSDNNNDSPNVEYEESKMDKENSIPLDQYSDSLLGKENEPSTLDVPLVNGTPQSKSGNIPRKGKYQKPISRRPNNIYNQGDNKGFNNPNMDNNVGLVNDTDSLEVIVIEGSPDDIWNTETSNPSENINNPGEITREYTSKNTQPDDEDIDSLWDDQNKEKSDALDINNTPQPKVDKIPSKKYQKPVLKRPAHLKPLSGNKVVGPLSSDNNNDSPNVEYEESKMDKENSIPLDQYSDSLLGKENEPSTLDVPLVNGTPQSKSGNIPRKGKYQKPISRRPNNIYNQGDNKGFNNPNMDNNVGLVNDTDSLEVIVIEGSPDDIWNTETSNPSENINNPGEITREYTSKNTQPDDEDIDSLWDDQNKEKSDALDINNTPQSKVDKIPSKKYQKPVLKRPAYLKPLSGNKVVGPLSSDNNNDSPNVEYEESKMDKENSIPLDQYSDSLWGKENEPSTLDVPPVNGTPQSKSGNIPRKGKYQKPISRRPNNIYNQGDNKGLNNPNMNNLEVVEIEGSPDDIWNTEMSNPTENINNPGEIVREYTSKNTQPDDEDIDSLWDEQNKEKSDALDINNMPQPKVDKIPSKKYQKPVLKRPAHLKPFSGNKVVGPLSSDNNNDSPNVEYEESKMDKENSIPLDQYSDSLLGKENEPSTLDVPLVNGTPQSKSGNIPRKGKYQKPISRRPNNIYNQGDNKGFNNPNMDNNVGLVNDTDSLEVIVIEGSPDDIWNTETSNPSENINNPGEITREYTSKNTQPDDEDIDSLWDDQNKEKSDALDINNTPQPKVDKIPSKKYQKPVLKRPAHLKPLSGNKVVGPLSSDNNNDSPNVEYEESKMDKENSIPLDQYSDSLLGKENEPSTLDVPLVNGTPQSKSGNIPRKGKYQKPISRRPNNIYNQGDNKGFNNPNMDNNVGLVNDTDSLEVIVIEGSPDDIWNTETSNPSENINNPGEITREYTSKNTQPDDEDIDSLWDDQNKEKSDALDINNTPQSKVDKIPSKKYQKPVLKRPAYLKPLSGNKVVGPLSSDNNNDSPNVEYEESKMDKENSIPLDQYSDSLLGKENEPSTLDIPPVNGTPQSKSGNIPRKGKYQKPISRRPNNIYNQGDNKGLNNPNMNNLEVVEIEGSPDDIWNTEMSNPTENINNHGEIVREYTSKNTQPDDEDIDSLWDEQNKEKSDALDINNTPQPKVDKIPSKKYQKPVLKRPAHLKPLSGNKVVGPLSSDNNNDSPNVEYEESKMDKENSIPLEQYSDSRLGKENEYQIDLPQVKRIPKDQFNDFLLGNDREPGISDLKSIPQHTYQKIPENTTLQKPISYNRDKSKPLGNNKKNDSTSPDLQIESIITDFDEMSNGDEKSLQTARSLENNWDNSVPNQITGKSDYGYKPREKDGKISVPNDQYDHSQQKNENEDLLNTNDEPVTSGTNGMPQHKYEKIPKKGQLPIPTSKSSGKLKSQGDNKLVGFLSPDENNDFLNIEDKRLEEGKENFLPKDQYDDSVIGNKIEDGPVSNDEPVISSTNGMPHNTYEKIPNISGFQKPSSKIPEKSKSLENNIKNSPIFPNNKNKLPNFKFDESINKDKMQSPMAHDLSDKSAFFPYNVFEKGPTVKLDDKNSIDNDGKQNILKEDDIYKPTISNFDNTENDKPFNSVGKPVELKTNPGRDSNSKNAIIPMLNSNEENLGKTEETDKSDNDSNIIPKINELNIDEMNFPIRNSLSSEQLMLNNYDAKPTNPDENTIDKPTMSDIINSETDKPFGFEGIPTESKTNSGDDSKNNLEYIPLLNSKEDTSEIWGTDKSNDGTIITPKVSTLNPEESNSQKIGLPSSAPESLTSNEKKLTILKENTINKPTMTDINNAKAKKTTDSNEKPPESKTSPSGDPKNIFGEIPLFISKEDGSSEIWGSEKPVEDTKIPPEVNELNPNKSNSPTIDSPVSEPESLTDKNDKPINPNEGVIIKPTSSNINNPETKTPFNTKDKSTESKTSPSGDSKHIFGEIPLLISKEDVSSEIWGSEKPVEYSKIPPEVSELNPDESNFPTIDSPVSEPESLTGNDEELTNLEGDSVNEPTKYDLNNPEIEKTTSSIKEPPESKTSPSGDPKNIFGEIPLLISKEDVSSEIWGSEKPVEDTKIPLEVNELNPIKSNSPTIDSPVSEPESLTDKNDKPINPNEGVIIKPTSSDINNPETKTPFNTEDKSTESKTSPSGDSKNIFGEIPLLISKEDVSSEIWGSEKPVEDINIPPVVSEINLDESNSPTIDSPVSEPESLTGNAEELINLEGDSVNEPTKYDLNNPETDKTTSSNEEPLESKTSPDGDTENNFGEIPLLDSKGDISSEIWGSEKPVEDTNIPPEMIELNPDESNSPTIDSPVSEPESLTGNDEELTNLEGDSVNEPTKYDLNNPETDKTTSSNEEPLESKTSPDGDTENNFGEIPLLDSKGDISSEIWGSEKPVEDTNIPPVVSELNPDGSNSPTIDSPVSEPESLTGNDEELTNLEGDSVNEPTKYDLNNPETDKTTSSNEEPLESKTSPDGDTENNFGEIPLLDSKGDISSEIWGTEKPVEDTNIPPEMIELNPDESNSPTIDSPVSEPESLTGNDEELTNLEGDSVNEPTKYDLNNPETDKTTSSNEEPLESKTSPDGDTENNFGEIPLLDSKGDISSEIWGTEKPVEDTNIPPEMIELNPDESNSPTIDSPVSEPESLTGNDEELTNLEEDSVNEPTKYDLNNPETDKTTSSNEEPLESKTSPGGDTENNFGEIPLLDSKGDISSEIWGTEKPVEDTNIPPEMIELNPDESNSPTIDSPVSEPESLTGNDEELTNLEGDSVNEPTKYDLNNPETDKTTSSNEEPLESKTSPDGDTENNFGEIPLLDSKGDISSEIWGTEKPVEDTNIPPEMIELNPDESNSPTIDSPVSEPESLTGNDEELTNLEEDSVNEPTKYDLNNPETDKTTSSNEEPLESKTSPGGDTENNFGDIPLLYSKEDTNKIWGTDEPNYDTNIPPEVSALNPDYEKPNNPEENVHEPTTSDFDYSDTENRISSEVEPDKNSGGESKNTKDEFADMNPPDLNNVPYVITPYDESETVEVDTSSTSSEKGKYNLMFLNSNVGLPNISTLGDPVRKKPKKTKTFLDSSSFNKFGDISILSSGSKNPDDVGNTGLSQPTINKEDHSNVPIEKVVNNVKAGNQSNKHKESSPNIIKSSGSNIIDKSSSGSKKPSKMVKLPMTSAETLKNKNKINLDKSLSSDPKTESNKPENNTNEITYPNPGMSEISHDNSNRKPEEKILVNVPDTSMLDTNQVSPDYDMNTGSSKPMLNNGDEPSHKNQKNNLLEHQGNKPVNAYQDMQLFKPNSIPSISGLNQFGYMIPKFRNNYESGNTEYDLWESLPPKLNMKLNGNEKISSLNKDEESKNPTTGSYHSNVISNNVNFDKNLNPNTEKLKNNDENNNNNNNNIPNNNNEKYDDFIKNMSEVLGKINDIDTKISKLENSNKANIMNSKDNVNIDELKNNDLLSKTKLTTKRKKKIKKEIDSLSPNSSLDESSNDMKKLNSNESDESDDINDSKITNKSKQNKKDKKSKSRRKKHNYTPVEKNKKDANLENLKKNNNDDTESVKNNNKKRKSKKAEEITSVSEINENEVDDINYVENIDESYESIEDLKSNRKSNKTPKKKKKKKISSKTKSKHIKRKKLTEDDSDDEQTNINYNDVEINHKENIIKNNNKQTKNSKNGKNRRNNNVVQKTIESNTVKTDNKIEITKNDSDNEASDGYQLVTFYPQYAYTNPFSRLFSRARPMYRGIY